MIASNFYFAALLLLVAGAVSAIVFRTNERAANGFAHGLAVLGSSSAVLCAFLVFRDGGFAVSAGEWPLFGEVAVRVDGLAAFFLLLAGFVGAAAGLYATGYCREYYGRRLWLMAANFNVFLLTIFLVFTVSHVVAFLVMWELMSLVSFLLVNHEWERAASRRAAFIYIVMTHIGTAFIITAFLLLATAAGSFDFGKLAWTGGDEWLRTVIFLCALLGFGTKAGMMPVHVWLPLAHPAAPSHISALMSGVMIKTAIYGLARFLLDFMGPAPLWWGQLMLTLAIVSCVLGVLYALMENDIKRLLAYSSVENIGIIMLGMGAGLVFGASGQPALAGLAWSAALLHALGHALFKSLLFFGAGAVVQATHTKDMEKLGGLIRLMPYTAVLFLAGAAAISALPGLIGFVSEWLTFQTLFYLPLGIAGIGGKTAGAIVLALFGLTGALAAACFVKAFGVAFLAKPRSEGAAHAREASGSMLAAMALPAAACLVLGLRPEPALGLVQLALAPYGATLATGIFSSGWFGFSFCGPAGSSSVMGAPLGLALAAGGGAAALALLGLISRPPDVRGETWTCGIIPDARMEYTGTGFAKPVRVAFAAILRPRRHSLVETAGNDYHGRRLVYRLSIDHILVNNLYRPLNAGVLKAAQKIKRLQSGSLQLYIGYILAVTVLALIWGTR